MKQYKKAIKAADALLKKHASHGETMAMKGLALHHVERRDEAWTVARAGLKLDVTSYICWHAFALMHRRDENYAESVKAYAQALRTDPDNPQLLRDIQLMQFLARDLDGMADTSRKMITAKPSIGANWYAFAAAMHLQGHHKLARDILNVWVDMEETAAPGLYATEAHASVAKTHLHLFLASLTAQALGGEAALAHLAKYEAVIYDKTQAIELRARFNTLVGRHDKAAECYRQLIDINVENVAYYDSLRAALQLPADDAAAPPLSDAQHAQWLAVVDGVAAKHPRAAVPVRLALRVVAANASASAAADGEFARRAELLLRSLLRKGVAAGFSVVHDAVRRAPRRRAQLVAIVDRYIASLRADGRLPALDGDKQAGELESPAVLFWALFFRAHCADADGDVPATLAYLAQAEAHTPTVVELYSYRALVYKRAGNAELAFAEREKARAIDLADRYLNNKSAKYALRAGKRAEAVRLLAMFTRFNETTRENEDPDRYMHDQQCTWFELEAGACHLAKGEIGNALYHYMWIDTHTNDIASDQTDFFAYCFRKVTLQAFVDFADFQSRLRSGPAWQKGAAGVVRSYLALADRADAAAKAQAAADADLEALSPAERKQLAAKKKKAEAAAAAAAPPPTAPSGKQQSKSPAAEDKGTSKAPKPPAELEQCADPLAEASRWVHRLVGEAAAGAFAPAAHRLALVVQTRAGRFLLAMRSARQVLLLGGAGDAEVERDVLLLLDAIDRATANTAAPLPAAVAATLDAARATLTGGGDVAARLAALPELARAEAALALANVRGGDNGAQSQALIALADRATRVECERWLQLLSAGNAAQTLVDQLRATAHKRFPLATAFQPQPVVPEATVDTTK